MASVQEVLYVFPPPPDADAVEWPGEPIGRSNVLTRTKTRTAIHDKTIDDTAGRREHLVNAAIAHLVQHGGRESTYLHDVVIHGIRVRAITNSDHLIQFWRENWYSPEEWQVVTGRPPPADPQVVVYALGHVPDEAEAAYYSRATSTIIFFNTSYYGQLKSWVLGAVGRVLAAEFGVHSLHGACVERAGEGVLYIAPTGTGKSTSSYGLMTYPGTRFHSDDWVYVRYARFTKHDQLVVPIEIVPDNGERVRGYRCNPWLTENPTAAGVARCLDLANRAVSVKLSELDHGRPIQAYAYTSEKVFYLRSNLVENFPDTADAILRANLENVPSPTPGFLAENRQTIESIIADLRTSPNEQIRRGLGSLPDERLRPLVGALFAFDNARAMLDIASVFPASRVFANPLEPVRLSAVFLLKRDPTDPVVLKLLTLDRFMERLLIGETPDGKREIAYNAYRAVNDEAEKSAVAAIERESAKQEIPLYQAFLRATELPESLREEFTLFGELYRSARCYDCNTTLQRDPAVTSKKEAVQLTLEVILRGIANRSPDLTMTLENYRSQLRT
jgi:hypothetical protein